MRETPVRIEGGLAENLRRHLAVQDVFSVVFLAYIVVRALLSPPSEDATVAREATFVLLASTTVALLLTRGGVIKSRRGRAIAYRTGIFFPVFFSYFVMRVLLPAMQPELLDQQLMDIDIAILGFTPSVVLQEYNTLWAVEWVSFFYYLHFSLLIVMVIPGLLRPARSGTTRRRQQELLGGTLTVLIMGHVGYTLVPAMGPWAHLEFAEPLHGGFWWHQVWVTVETAGSQMDVFPSLHTAYPTFFALHAYGHRRTRAFRYTWHLLAFIAANIVVATMFLRWHWFIDVVFGLLLAGGARWFSVWMARRDDCVRRQAAGQQQVWESF